MKNFYLGFLIVVLNLLIFENAGGADPRYSKVERPTSSSNDQKIEKSNKKKYSDSQDVREKLVSNTSKKTADKELKDSKEQNFQFKLGFEFQASGAICKKVSPNVLIQKRPIFEGLEKEGGEKLWHVEIDGQDIEFVTIPFSVSERKKLKLCLMQIQEASKLLQELFNSSEKSIFFEKWVSKLQENKIPIKVVTHEKKEINKLLDIKKLKMTTVKNFRFNPQVTIQHPLEYTIPLYFSLFGFDEFIQMKIFFMALPNFNYYQNVKGNYEDFRKVIKERFPSFLKKKIAGLAFLHALALVNMSPNVTEAYDDNSLLYIIDKEIKNQGTPLPQIDPKRNIMLVARRPFSAMFNNIKKGLKKSYDDYFKENLEQGNALFSELREVPKMLSLSNYGEQFYNDDGTIKDLSKFTKNINNQFYKDNIDVIKKLLKNGIIVTPVIRNLEKYPIKKNEYNNYIMSVDDPQYRLGLILGKDITVEEEKWDYDTLSPPFFLHKENSMGRIRGEEVVEEQYGEAIVEIRGIKKVGGWFLKKIEEPADDLGKFLQGPESIAIEGTKLFDFLKKFSMDENVLDDIHMGICYNILTVK